MEGEEEEVPEQDQGVPSRQDQGVPSRQDQGVRSPYRIWGTPGQDHEKYKTKLLLGILEEEEIIGTKHNICGCFIP